MLCRLLVCDYCAVALSLLVSLNTQQFEQFGGLQAATNLLKTIKSQPDSAVSPFLLFRLRLMLNRNIACGLYMPTLM